jgi:hypothetical protein
MGMMASLLKIDHIGLMKDDSRIALPGYRKHLLVQVKSLHRVVLL